MEQLKKSLGHATDLVDNLRVAYSTNENELLSILIFEMLEKSTDLLKLLRRVTVAAEGDDK